MGIMDRVNELLPGRHEHDRDRWVRDDDRYRRERDEERYARERNEERYRDERDERHDHERGLDDPSLSRRDREELDYSRRDRALSLRDDFDRWLHRTFENPFGVGRRYDARSGIDVRESDRELTARVETPGFDPNEVEVMVSPGRLTVRANADKEHRDEGRGYVSERRSFTRSVSLPPGVDLSQVEARMRHGLLTIRIPKIDSHRESRRIPIKD